VGRGHGRDGLQFFRLVSQWTRVPPMRARRHPTHFSLTAKERIDHPSTLIHTVYRTMVRVLQIPTPSVRGLIEHRQAICFLHACACHTRTSVRTPIFVATGSYRRVNPVARASCDATTWCRPVEGICVVCADMFAELTRKGAQSVTSPTNASTILLP
jgi:hypothetical protein